MSQQAEIRCYTVEPSGKLENLFDTDINHFGSCPVVGDTICREWIREKQFFQVVRRYFVDSINTSGWVLVLEPIKPSAEQKAVLKEWAASSKFWHDIDVKEKQESEDKQDKLIADLLAQGRAKSRK